MNTYKLAALVLVLVFLSLFEATAGDLKMKSNEFLWDLTTFDWRYVAFEKEEDLPLERVKGVKKWGKTKIGKRWELLGHPELGGKVVWIKTSFYVPENFGDQRIGFFCTAIDDRADFYLNGKLAGSETYYWNTVAKHTDIDLTELIEFGSENELIIRIEDISLNRMSGLIGNVFLYRTEAYSRTNEGGIKVSNSSSDRYQAILHLGLANLEKRDQTLFTASQLETLQVPPSILREDELILVLKESEIEQPFKYQLDLDNVNSITDGRPLEVTLGELPESIGLNEKFDIPIDIKATYRNPFDPAQVKVQAIIKTPGGKIEPVKAFFNQDFEAIQVGEEEEILLPVPSDPWKLYYRPRTTGLHELEVIVQDTSGVATTGIKNFEVKNSEGRGFLRISESNPKYFEFDNGDSYFGLGPSGWFRGSNFIFGGNPRWVPLSMMKEWLQKKSANGSNFDYTASFHFGRLLITGGFMDLHVAWKLEQMLRAMEELDIYWLFFHDDIRRYSSYGFDNLPYAAANGGPATNLQSLYMQKATLDLQKSQLRYIISRMADSPSLWIWNCGDEVQPGDKFSKNMVNAWIKELHSYIRQQDIYEHLHAIGESESVHNGGDLIVQEGWYYSDNPKKHLKECMSVKLDAVGYNQCLLEPFRTLPYPVISPEGGICEWNGRLYLSGEKYDYKEMISYHQHLWISLFMQMAAGGTEWLCNVVDRDNQLYHTKAISNYLEDIPLSKHIWTTTVQDLPDNNAHAYFMKSDLGTLSWLRNKSYTWHEAGYLKKSVKVLNDFHVEIPVCQNGKYRVEYWNTRKGEIEKVDHIEARTNVLDVAIRGLEDDIALKAFPASSESTEVNDN